MSIQMIVYEGKRTIKVCKNTATLTMSVLSVNVGHLEPEAGCSHCGSSCRRFGIADWRVQKAAIAASGLELLSHLQSFLRICRNTSDTTHAL